jgi:predicted nucleic acid-binding protein
VTGLACDTSVLVPALLSWHPQAADAREAMDGVDGLPAHVLLEAYSVLTRLPAPHRFAAADAGRLLHETELRVLSLTARQHRQLLTHLVGNGIRGGAVYDALVGATAREHGHTLITRDLRARATYDAVGVRYRMF